MADDNILAADDGNTLAASSVPMSEPPIGSGPGAVSAWLRANGQTLDPTKAPWCGAYTNAYLNANGLPTMPRLTGQVATNWLGYGNAVDGPPQKNDVLVMPRGLSAGKTGGHVGVATGDVRVNPETGETEYAMHSGNEGGKVSTDFVPASEIVVRRPQTPAQTPPVQVAQAPAVSSPAAAPVAPMAINPLTSLASAQLSPMQRLQMYQQLAAMFRPQQRQQQAQQPGQMIGGVDASIPLRVA